MSKPGATTSGRSRTATATARHAGGADTGTLNGKATGTTYGKFIVCGADNCQFGVHVIRAAQYQGLSFIAPTLVPAVTNNTATGRGYGIVTESNNLGTIKAIGGTIHGLPIDYALVQGGGLQMTNMSLTGCSNVDFEGAGRGIVTGCDFQTAGTTFAAGSASSYVASGNLIQGGLNGTGVTGNKVVASTVGY